MPDADDQPFPWALGVFDAHCHPTDTMAAVPDITSMRARALTIMATRAQDQTLVRQVADSLGVQSRDIDAWGANERVVPCFGWHPWFAHQLYDEALYGGHGELAEEQRAQHYEGVFAPGVKREQEAEFLRKLPAPRPLGAFLAELRDALLAYPLALVGEVGLDKSFRVPVAWGADEHAARDEGLTPGGREGRLLSPHGVAMAHQRKVLTAQLNLAGELGRAVSVHGVQAHGVLFETIRETWRGFERVRMSRRERKRRGVTAEEEAEEEAEEYEEADGKPKPFPPRLCLHSYSGHASQLKQYFDPSVPVDVFVSFSAAINFSERGAAAARDAVVAVPEDRLLVESDLHSAGKDMDEGLEEVVRLVCELRGWGLEEGVKRLRANWERFVFGRGKRKD
ncbi:uncharacterized protein K452DRAFT_292692 [Aplosporella prunicola CBS 121167]|uniref:Metallo-dependent hydrolase n=1 Tax=Aplosporella prunicola CBS 121167 TaxID=1176127 RepID=A0A6A6AWK9_9PEZI|nr:uncharacterized protein K452DRAFT_292692 [Aplosporella prunicola CBS 121167]KAF2136110.1 hypothetical protein K452DRAFT_292692 [Aplosporella prunicola CBS 121167]